MIALPLLESESTVPQKHHHLIQRIYTHLRYISSLTLALIKIKIAVDVESLVVDFSSFDDNDKANVAKAIKDKEVIL